MTPITFPYRGHQALFSGPVSEPEFINVPTGSRLRPDAPLGPLKLAVARALEAQMTTLGHWQDLALLVGAPWILGGKLLDAQRHGDGDCRQLVHDVVDTVLGVRHDEDSWGNYGGGTFVDHLVDLEDHLDLPDWLAAHELRLHRVLYGADPAAAAALDAVAGAATDLDLPEVVRQLDRQRRDLADDLPAAIGHAKDLVEGACKIVIGPAAAEADARKTRPANVPTLVAAALKAVGRHPDDVDRTTPDGELQRQVLVSLQRQLDSIAALRNRAGTGHGRGGDVPLDALLVRLVITQAMAAVAYLLQACDLQATDAAASAATQPAAAGVVS
jgi:Abortive infection C-terminus